MDSPGFNVICDCVSELFLRHGLCDGYAVGHILLFEPVISPPFGEVAAKSKLRRIQHAAIALRAFSLLR